MLTRKRIIILVIFVVLGTALAGLGVWGIKYVRAFPETHPDKTLELGQRLEDFIARITLPIKLAKLSLQEADKELLMPVLTANISGVADTYGAPRGEDRGHEGQDLFADLGTPVFSATTGYITRIRENSELGGNNVYIAGPGGRRYYYAHLDRFADGLRVGQAVTTDTVIGFVGNTGNAITTPYHLHFGVYEHREAINPLPLIVDRP